MDKIFKRSHVRVDIGDCVRVCKHLTKSVQGVITH